MKTKLFLTLVFLVHLVCIATAQNEKKGEDINKHRYLIVSYTGSINNKDFSVYLDDGETIDYYRNEKGEKAHFHTPAAAILFFESLGCELISINSYPNGTITYMIFKKPCSKEEYEKIIIEACK